MAAVLEDNALASYLSADVRPSFDRFVKTVREQYGKTLNPAVLREFWADRVLEELVQQPGRVIARIVTGMGLVKQDRALQRNRQAGRPEVADPLPEPSISEIQALPRYKKGPRAGMLKPFPESMRIPPEVRRQQAIRNSAIAAIGEKLIREAQEGRKAWRRTEIKPDELSYERAGAVPAYQDITTTGARTIADLKRILTDRAGIDRTTKVKRLVGGKVVEIQQKAPPESVTRRVTILRNVKDKTVHMASTYQAGTGDVMILHPDWVKFERPSVKLDELLREGRYRVQGTALVDEPVQHFHQQFKNLAEFEERFANE